MSHTTSDARRHAVAALPSEQLTTTTGPDPQTRPLRRLGAGVHAEPHALALGAQALARVRYPWQELLPGWAVRFLGGRPGLLGRTFWPDRVIELYVRPTHGVGDVAFALAHELGHAVDLEHLDPTGRACWRATRELPHDLEWFGASDANDFATPAGDWAECFAAWQLGPDGFQSRLGAAPGPRDRELVAELSLVHHARGSRGARTMIRREWDHLPISRLKPAV